MNSVNDTDLDQFLDYATEESSTGEVLDDSPNASEEKEERTSEETKRVYRENYKNPALLQSQAIIAMTGLIPRMIGAATKQDYRGIPEEIENILSEAMRPYIDKNNLETIPPEMLFWGAIIVLLGWNLVESGVLLKNAFEAEKAKKKQIKKAKAEKVLVEKRPNRTGRSADESFQINSEGLYKRLRKEKGYYKKKYSFRGNLIPASEMKGELAEKMSIDDLYFVVRDNRNKDGSIAPRLFEAMKALYNLEESQSRKLIAGVWNES